ncbi:MAG: aminotransferase class V-fold PLP-dependent enzyme [Pirellulaceae bacterium]
MPPTDRIYLDNAATSWPKPAAVYEAVDHYMRFSGAAAGRGAYREAAEVERLVSDARKRLADLIGEPKPKRIIFTSNGTDSLNLALHGFLRAGEHVVTSVCEHNSVLRPLRHLENEFGVSVTRVRCGANGIVDPSDFESAITSHTKLFVLTHASNVTGAIQPAEEIGHIARSHGIRYLVDAAQSLGHIPVFARQLYADLIAAPGHKGLLGPLGTGLLYVAPGVEAMLRSTRQGGTGTTSESDWQPETLPEKYESGNHNVPGIVGLGAALAYLDAHSGDHIRQREQELTSRLLTGFQSHKNVTIHGPRDATRQVGVVSITIDGYDPQEAATMLDTAYSVQVRSGLHCAPLMHASLNTQHRGGTVRFSIGAFTTDDQIDRAIEAVGEIAAAAI